MDGKRSRDQYEMTQEYSANKKPRMTEEQTPSRVLHVRSLPPDTTEAELGQLCLPFGRVVGVLMLSNKAQAFVQMEDVSQAIALVQYYNSVHAVIRGNVVYFQFSNRSELTTGHISSGSGSGSSASEKQNRILLVSVSNLLYPITIDVLQRVFRKYGVILRIVTFSKGAVLQALIEFETVMAAALAKAELEGQNIYTGCCTLSLQFSNLEVLTVKYNNDKSRDFTNPNLPAGDSGASSSSQSEPSGYPYGGAYASHSMAMAGGAAAGYPQAMSSVGLGAMAFGQQQAMGPTVLIVSGLDESRVNPDILFTLFGVYGDVLRVKIMFNRKDTALIQYQLHSGAELACQNLNGISLFGKPLKVNFSKHQHVAIPKESSAEADNLTKDYTGHPLHRFRNPNSKHSSHIIPPGDMLHIHNLPADITEEQVIALFGQYGTVVGFKFFENNRKMALLQMSSVDEAVHALIFLHGYPIAEGSSIRVSFSKSKIKKDE